MGIAARMLLCPAVRLTDLQEDFPASAKDCSLLRASAEGPSAVQQQAWCSTNVHQQVTRDKIHLDSVLFSAGAASLEGLREVLSCTPHFYCSA